MKYPGKFFSLSLFLLIAGNLFASIATTPDPRMQSYPWMSLSRWYSMHAEDVAHAEAGESKLVFWGDSITEGWNGNGRALWDEHFAPLGAVNFGIGGDMTQNLLWRLKHGSTGKLYPEKVVLLIGTNNYGFTIESPIQVAAGVTAVVGALQDAYPHVDILLMAVFPRSREASHPHREKIRLLNAALAPLGQQPGVTFCDIGDQFLLADGTIDVELMPDYLHLSEAGYLIWAEAILEWMGQQ